MKKFLVLMLALCLLLPGCGGEPEVTDPTQPEAPLPPLEAFLGYPEDVMREMLIGLHREAVLDVWGQPNEKLDGANADAFYMPKDPKYLVVYYDKENRVNVIKVSSRYDSTQVTAFSYADVQKAFPAGAKGVRTEGFRNTEASAVRNGWMALTRAKAECTISYISTSVAYDEASGMWQVTFSATGETLSVYLDSDGITRLVVHKT